MRLPRPAPHIELTEAEQKTLQALLKNRQTAQGQLTRMKIVMLADCWQD